MIIIAHRGNTKGVGSCENNPRILKEILSSGRHCEIDVWRTKSKYYLGHDEPSHPVQLKWLRNYSYLLWIHCKNLEALNELNRFSWANIFYLDNDSHTLTRKNVIWATYNSKHKRLQSDNMVFMIPGMINLSKYNLDCFGICCDGIA